jgi:hypothetical protein
MSIFVSTHSLEPSTSIVYEDFKEDAAAEAAGSEVVGAVWAAAFGD